MPSIKDVDSLTNENLIRAIKTRVVCPKKNIEFVTENCNLTKRLCEYDYQTSNIKGWFRTNEAIAYLSMYFYSVISTWRLNIGQIDFFICQNKFLKKYEWIAAMYVSLSQKSCHLLCSITTIFPIFSRFHLHPKGNKKIIMSTIKSLTKALPNF